ncbi:MAG: cold shock domain-containing protein [Patescibacteria group bacterium]
MQNGTVIKKNLKGFGFIKVDGAPDGSKDLFFHSNELRNISFDELQEGDKVSFEVGDSPKGRNALNVSKI